MADSSFLLGMLQGGATGVVNNQIAMREQELQKERAQLQIAGELIRSGQFETFMALDPKIRKSVGVSPDLEGALNSLIGVQREERGLRMRNLLSQTRAGESQARAAEMDVEREQQRQNIIRSRPQEEQQELLVPEIPQRRATLATEKAQAAKLRETEIDIDTKQRISEEYKNLSPANKLIVDFPTIAQIQVTREGQRLQAGSAAANRASQERIAQFDRESRERIASLGLQKEEQRQATALENQKSKLRDDFIQLYSKTKNKTKVGEFTYGTFNTKEEADAYLEQVNKLIREHNAIDARQASLTGQTPDPLREWKSFNKTEGGGLLGWAAGLVGAGEYFQKDKFYVGPPMVEEGAPAPVNEFEQRLQKLLGELQGATAAQAQPTQVQPRPEYSQPQMRPQGEAPAAETAVESGPPARITSRHMDAATARLKDEPTINRYIEFRNQGLTHNAAMNAAARGR